MSRVPHDIPAVGLHEMIQISIHSAQRPQSYMRTVDSRAEYLLQVCLFLMRARMIPASLFPFFTALVAEGYRVAATLYLLPWSVEILDGWLQMLAELRW